MYYRFTQAKQILQVQGLKFYLNKAKKFYVWSDHNADIKNVINEYSSDYNIFVDIGANFGKITIDSAKYFSKCLCFEPSIENFNKLSSNLQKNKISNVSVYNCALGKKSGTGKLFLAPNLAGQNRLAVAPEEDWNWQDVDIRTLDDVMEELDIHEKCIIKIDAEGSELAILEGSKKTLQKDCLIISEFNPMCLSINDSKPSDYVDFLKSLGYSFFNLNGKPTAEKYLDHLCLRGKDKKFVCDDFLIKKN